MKILRAIAALLGALMVAMGLLWIGQGLDMLRWPADSFMIGEPRWSWNGAALAVLGAVLVWAGLARRR